MRKGSAMSNVSSEASAPDVSASIKGAMHTGMGAIEKVALAAAEVPLSVLSSLGVPDEARATVRHDTELFVAGITAALNTVADGTTDATAGVATGITRGVSAGVGVVGDIAGKLVGAGSTT